MPKQEKQAPKKQQKAKTLSPIAQANKKLKGTPEMKKRMDALRAMRGKKNGAAKKAAPKKKGK